MQQLTEQQLTEGLASLPCWQLETDHILRTFRFAGFGDAIDFVDRVAVEAERARHHPDIVVRYNHVTLTLSTHDAGGLTQKDLDLASVCDGLASGMGD